MNGLLDILKRFGPARLAAMGAVTLALVAFFAFVIMRVTQPTYAILFTDLDVRDSSAIVKKLEAAGVPYELGGDGASIRVPEPQVASLRMSMAGDGLPSGGGIGYEIFDKGDSLSATSFVQNINGLRALEGELARTIRSIDRVEGARVHLVIPEKALFQRDRQEPSASIALKVRGGPEPGQIRAIRHLVASAVEGLVPERISIVDERGRLLADGSGSADGSLTMATGEDKRVGIERRVRAQVEDLLTGIVGPGRSRVQVAAELDFNRVESRQENFDPEGRVVRSTQTRGETSQTSGTEGQVSVGTELPGAQNNAAANQPPREQTQKNEELVNYEISRTTRTEVQEAGRLKRLSVAVLVDGTYAKGGSGEAAYQPRSKEDLDRIAALVRSAVGFDAKRGDQVEVVNMAFAETPQALDGPADSLLGSLMRPSREDVMRWAELGVISLLTLLVLLVVVRPMVRRVIAPEAALPAPGFQQVEGSALAGPAAAAAIAGPDAAGAAASGMPALAGAVGPDQMARLGEVAGSNPRQSAAVLRGWMSGR